MSRELSLYEAMGGTYTEIDGVFYPDISIEEIKPDGDFGVTNADIGKYGLINGHMVLYYKHRLQKLSAIIDTR